MKLGVEVLLERLPHLIKGKRIGLITNHTGVDFRLRSTVDLLHDSKDWNLVALFGPEHGIWGNAQDDTRIESAVDERTGLPIYSLYGETVKLTPEMLRGINLLIYDIQDVGARFYTYISTLMYAMEAASEKRIPIIVLDRPNPITASRVEGPVLEAGFESFVGAFRIPTRYGMTVGELAALINREVGVGADLKVVPMESYKREMWYDETGLLWVMPSPNMPTLETAAVYPGTAVFEGTNISEGRGTTRPFEIVGAPWLDPFKFADELNSLGLPGTLFRPLYFTPTFSKFRGELCGGVQVHVTDRRAFEPVRTGLTMLWVARRLSGERFRWNARHFDLLMGTDKVRLAIERGESPEEIVARWEKGLREFMAVRGKYLIYK
ncbi:MAG: exo-beta-N-acetylmuramidase NamZ family protein [bacterium]